MNEPLLAVEDLHAGYASGIDVLQGLSLTVARGSLTLIIGPNGAGKSTLLKVLFGFLNMHRGRVRFAGAPIDGFDVRYSFGPTLLALRPGSIGTGRRPGQGRIRRSPGGDN